MTTKNVLTAFHTRALGLFVCDLNSSHLLLFLKNVVIADMTSFVSLGFYNICLYVCIRFLFSLEWCDICRYVCIRFLFSLEWCDICRYVCIRFLFSLEWCDICRYVCIRFLFSLEWCDICRYVCIRFLFNLEWCSGKYTCAHPQIILNLQPLAACLLAWMLACSRCVPSTC